MLVYVCTLSYISEASQWINEYYSTAPRQHSGHYAIPYKGTMTNVEALGLDYPDYVSPIALKSGLYTMNRRGSGKATGKGGNLFGTWSGRQLNKLEPKKGKKWYKFSFSKSNLKKSKPLGKENDGFSNGSSTLPLTKSTANANFSSLGRQQLKQDGDIGLRSQWNTSRDWENQDEGIPKGG